MAVMLVDFGKTRTGVGIVHRGVLMYTSTIDIGGAQMSTAMRTFLGNDVPEKELTRLKNTYGLKDAGKKDSIHHMISPTITALANELSARMQYWNSRSDDTERSIEEVVLCGGSANLAGLSAYLREELEIPVRRAQVWQNAFSLESYVPEITRPYSYGYATAVGLALADHTIL